MTRFWILATLAIVAAVGLPMTMQAVGVPHTFVDGDIASADDVNANFAALRDAVNQLRDTPVWQTNPGTLTSTHAVGSGEAFARDDVSYSVGAPFVSLLATVSAGNVSYSVTSGVLPAGMLLDSSTGAIHGDPDTATAGDAEVVFTVTATNSPSNVTAQRTFAIDVRTLDSDEVLDTTTSWVRSGGNMTLASHPRDSGAVVADSKVTTSTAYNGWGLGRTFDGDFEVIIRVESQNFIGGGVYYGTTVDAATAGTSANAYGAAGCGSNSAYWGFAPWCAAATYMGGYHAPWAGAGNTVRDFYFRFRRTGNVLTNEYVETSSSATPTSGWQVWTINGTNTANLSSNDKVVVAIGEAGNTGGIYTIRKVATYSPAYK